MPNDPAPDDLKTLWQSQAEERVTISLDEIRSKARKFERRIYWRNIREYLAGALAIIVVAPKLWHLRGARLIPGLLLIAGVLYVLAQIYRSGSARPVPADLGLTASLEFHRRQLERQRDLLRTVWSWYLLPFVPGFVAVLVVAAMDNGVNAAWYLTAALFATILVGTGELNRWAARKLDRKIQELKGLEK